MDIKETFDTMFDRFKSPVWGPLTIAFVLANWRAMMYIFFDLKTPVKDRISSIEHVVNLQTLVLYPIAAWVIVLLMTPFFNEIVSALKRWMTVQFKGIEYANIRGLERKKHRHDERIELEKNIHQQRQLILKIQKQKVGGFIKVIDRDFAIAPETDVPLAL